MMGAVREPVARDFRIQVPAHPTEYGVLRDPLTVHGATPAAGLDARTGLLLVTLGFATPPEVLFFVKLRRRLADLYNLVVIGVDYLGTRTKRTRTTQWRADVDALIDRVHDRHGAEEAARCREPGGRQPERMLRLLAGSDLSDVVTLTEGFPDQSESDYLDYGFVQAVDLLTAVHATLERIPGLNRGRIHLVGSSLGAYLAQQANRFAPHTFASVLDLCGKASLGDRYLVKGRARKATADSANTRVALVNASVYQVDDPAAPWFLSPASRTVRDSLAAPIAFEGVPPRITLVAGEGDDLAPLAEKRHQLECLRNTGAELAFHVVTAADVDGTTIRHTGHGLGAEFYHLIRRFGGADLERRTRPTGDDFLRGSRVPISSDWTLNLSGPPRLVQR